MNAHRSILKRMSPLALSMWLGVSACAWSQSPHPSKAAFADAQQWAATRPGTVELKDFRPFRAVYDRKYTQASGPGQGEPRQDRVIVYAEEVGWDGERAVAITMIDSAVPEHADTNMRGLFMVASLPDLTLRFEVGPAPGKAKDYYLGLVGDDGIRLSMVDTTAQELQPQKVPVTEKGFGPGAWVFASMELEEGMKVRLDPYYSPQTNPISQASFGRVLGRKQVQDASGTEHMARVLETPGWYGPNSSRVLRLHLLDEPPYLVGTETYDYDTEETSRFVWLRSFEETRP